MYKTEDEIWEAVKNLTGKTIRTLKHNRPNYIVTVEDTGNLTDEVHIKDRSTKPTKEDITEAYKVLIFKGELDRKNDLSAISGVDKQKSSIVSAITYYIAKGDAELIVRDKRIIISLLK